ncbi:MAG: divergent polysaccharide deacetylase family protein, partial [Caulobacteraceae bacterium]
MFARKPALAAATSAPAPSLPAWTLLLANPFVGAGSAAMLLLIALGGLVLIAGDPQAGAPRVRVALQGGEHGDGADLKRGLYPGAPGPEFTLDNLLPGQELSMPGAPDAPVSGEAVITLPQGATLGGGMAGAPRLAAGRVLGPPLPTSPIAGLTAPGPGGLLPIIGPDGKTPFQAYARPFRDNGKPKVALVVGGLGLNAATTRAAVDRLPPEVTLSFVPYADGLQGWIDLARANGHEVLLETPMEPVDYPQNDPGPYTLMAGDPAPTTIKRLEWLLSRASGYVGLTNYLGGRLV